MPTQRAYNGLIDAARMTANQPMLYPRLKRVDRKGDLMYVYPFESVHVYRGGSHLTVTANRAGFYIYLETSTAKIHWQVPAFPLALFNVLRESLQRTYSEDVTKNVEPFVCGGIPQNVTGSLELLDDGFALLTLTELFGQTAKIKLRKTEVGKFAEALRNFFTC